MTTKQTVRLLLLHNSQDEAELLINTVRNSGLATRAELVSNEESLANALKNNWDILITCPQVGDMTAQATVDAVLRLGKDIPIIITANEDEMKSAADLIKRGAKDVILSGASAHVLAAINR